jgi:hypothetical protein
MARQDAIAGLVTEETSGTLGWGMFNVRLGAGMLAYYAAGADLSAEEYEISSKILGKRARAVRQAVGVVVGIAPLERAGGAWSARDRGAAGVWEHGGVESIGAVPTHPCGDR